MEFKLNKYNKNISDEDLLNDLIRVAKSLKKDSVTINEYIELGKFSYGSVRYHFGSGVPR